MRKRTLMRAGRHAFALLSAIPRDDKGKGNPLTLEDTIRSMILKHPDMLQYRDDALGLLYCTLGTGIQWLTNGRLGDGCPNNYINMPPEPIGQGCWTRDFGRTEIIADMLGPSPSAAWRRAVGRIVAKQRKRDMLGMERIVETIEQIDARCHQYRLDIGATYSHLWYPISWYACHLAVPANAQDDFIDGAVETATLILSFDPPPGTQTWLRHQQTKTYARDILELLLERKRLAKESKP